jgi:predicted RNA-binding Zn-ribbon protein involved in translation (DUF1610 family)
MSNDDNDSKKHKCDICSSLLSSISSLNYHKKTNNKCILLRGNKCDINKHEYTCSNCGFKTNLKKTLKVHKCRPETIEIYKTSLSISDIKNKYEEDIINIKNKYEEELKILKEKLDKSEEENERLVSDNFNLERKIEKHEEKLYNMASRPTTVNTTNTFENDSTIIIEDTDTDTDTDEVNEYKLTPLEVGQGYTIEHREEDGYINVTNLCKAGDKQYKHWFSLQKTKAFLQVLSSSVGIPTNKFIKYSSGSIKERATWSHPQVAINISQWISPRFDVKVSGWVYEIMMTGKVDITNTKTYKELQLENKNKELKIQYLTKKYVKKQPRVDYKERNVIYILTTANMKKERRYILGKAENLTNRLSVYNKSDEHEVIYYQECSDEEKMSIAETMIFNRLKDYREQANRERFVLPENKDVEYFKDMIKKVIEFIN